MLSFLQFAAVKSTLCRPPYVLLKLYGHWSLWHNIPYAVMGSEKHFVHLWLSTDNTINPTFSFTFTAPELTATFN